MRRALKPGFVCVFRGMIGWRRTRTVLTAIVFLGAVTVAVSPSDATFSGPNGLLVYQTQVGKHIQLFSVKPDGTAVRQLTHFSDSDAIQPAWSPNGERIAFVRDFLPGRFNEHGDVYTMNADGGDLRPLGIRGKNFWPSWSPDGKRIVFLHPGLLRIVNTDGSHLTQAPLAGRATSPVFSPKGNRIAVVRGEQKASIFITNAAGKALGRLTPPRGGLADKIDWSPDGSRFVISSPEFDRPGHAANVFTIRSDGTAARQLTHDRGDAVDDGSDSWSPDGKKIAFVRFRHGVYQIYVMRADGTQVVRVTHSAAGGHLAAWGTHR